jgi:hypothetical protein
MRPISLVVRRSSPLPTMYFDGSSKISRPPLLLAGEDDPVDNLIWVSFVENATGDSESEHALRDRLRSFPNLAHALSHYE